MKKNIKNTKRFIPLRVIFPDIIQGSLWREKLCLKLGFTVPKRFLTLDHTRPKVEQTCSILPELAAHECNFLR